MRFSAPTAFLGLGRVTIATPLKQEAINARPVVAVEDVTGSQRLGELARSLGIEPSYETIPWAARSTSTDRTSS